MDVVLIATRDPDVPRVAAALAARGDLAPRTAVLHVAGALGADALAPLRGRVAGLGQAHPLLSFASVGAPPSLRGATLLLSGDAVAVRRGRALARALGMVPREWPAVDRAAYHAAAALVANGATALAAAGETLLVAAGAPAAEVARALGPLLASVGQNVHRLGLPAALTGPVRRGDASTIERHLSAIRSRAPALEPLYAAVAAAQLPLARALGEAPEDAFRAIERSLVGRAAPGGRRGSTRARAREEPG